MRLTPEASPPQPDWRAERPWLADTVVCDGLLPWTAEFLPADADLGAQLRRFHAAGVDHISLTVAAGRDGALDALTRLGFLHRDIRRHRSWLRIADSATTIRAAQAEGAMSVSFHFQTATPFTPDLDLVEAFHAAGIRRAILAYNDTNDFADGCHAPLNAGLSALGRQLVQRMDAVGLVIDLSHCGMRTSFDVMAAPLSRAPIFSHSNARALFDHERNLTDAQIRACGARGGYIGIHGVGMYMGVDGPRIPEMMARHAAHIAALIGAERVGLGLDFMFLEGSDYGFFHHARDRWPRGYPEPPWAFLQPEQLGELVVALEAKGFSRTELTGLLGDNYLRLAL